MLKISGMIIRKLQKQIEEKLGAKKAIILFGARQVGKTYLVKTILKEIPHLWLSGDEPDVQQLVQNATSSRVSQIAGANKIIVIDEAQMINNIGLLIKRVVDNVENLQIIATGSSAFELADKTKESLVGRKHEFQLFPIALPELVAASNWLTQQRLLPHYLVYGLYPEVINQKGNEEEVLIDITESFLFKDVLNFEGINKSSIIVKLTQMLAFRVGSEINYNSLANDLGINKITVEKYIDILEQNFIVFILNSFSKNIDNELKKGKKVYFWDNGIRNALIKQFAPTEIRQDVGALWENFAIVEILKERRYNKTLSDFYFWRTTQQQEIDLIEVHQGKLIAYEIKYNPKQRVKFSKTFVKNYQPQEMKVVHPDNLLNLLQQ